jgi:hypothetical protein
MVTHQEKVETSSLISELLLQLSLPSPGVYGGTSTDLPFSDLQQAGGVFGPTNKDVRATHHYGAWRSSLSSLAHAMVAQAAVRIKQQSRLR